MSCEAEKSIIALFLEIYFSSSEVRFFNKSVQKLPIDTFPVVDLELVNPIQLNSLQVSQTTFNCFKVRAKFIFSDN